MAWHPVIEVRLAKASDVAALEDENARLRRERDYLRSQYMNECEINLRLEDILREHGISPNKGRGVLPPLSPSISPLSYPLQNKNTNFSFQKG